MEVTQYYAQQGGLSGQPNVGTEGGNTTAKGYDEAQRYLDAAVEDDWVARNYYGALSSGERAKLLYERATAKEAREYERWLADTAWQRKVADLQKAGFSPLAALEASGQGAALPTTSGGVRAASGNANNGLGGLLGAVLAAVAMIATKGMAASATAKGAAASAAQGWQIKQANEIALAALRKIR